MDQRFLSVVGPIAGGRGAVACRLGWVLGIGLGLGPGVTGCQRAVSRPISSSLQDLLHESRPVRGPVFEHHGVYSIAGLLPMADVGLIYHYPNHERGFVSGRTLPPDAAIGISRNHTFKLVGTMGSGVNEADVNAVVASLDEVRRSAARATGLVVSQARLRAVLRRADPGTDAEGVRREIAVLEEGIRRAESDLETSLKELRERASEPGILLAEWSTDESSAGGVGLGALFGASRESSRKRSGFVILGGLRVSHLYFGDDLKDIYLNLEPDDRVAFRFAGITTYTLQARHVRYVSSLSLSELVELYADVPTSQLSSLRGLLGEIDRVRIRSYWAAAARLENQGSPGDGAMDWSVVEVPLGEDVDKTLAGSLSGGTSDGGLDGWQTVAAVVTTADKLIPLWDKSIGAREHIRLGVLELPGDGSPASAVGGVNGRLRLLQASLSSDKSYRGTVEAYRSLERLRDAIAGVNARGVATISERDERELRSAEAALGSVVDILELDERSEDERRGLSGWGSLYAASYELTHVLLGLDHAAACLERVGGPGPAEGIDRAGT